MLGWLASAERAPAQVGDEPAPPVAAMVRGRVVIPVGDTVTPVGGVFVTLHRVGPDAAGALDSVRSGPDGRYTLSYTRHGSDEAVYFTAVVFRDIAYFSPPLATPRTREDDGVVVVFDTTATRVAFGIQGHHIIVARPGPDGTRKVVEVYELSNDTTVTVVGKDSMTAVWSAALPDGVSEFAGGQGDVSAVALVQRHGRVLMLAPFNPGIKQLSYSYTMPPGAFPLQLTLEAGTGVLEVLLEEEGAQVRGASLRSEGSVTTAGRTFKRFLGQGAPKGETLRIDVPVVAASTRVRVLMGLAVVMAVAMAAALLRALRRRGSAVRVAPAAAARPEALAAAIAALDARHEAGDATLSAESYAAERASLKQALTAALDGR
ncbi:MAG: hypothetical protein JWL60_1992 [Gemmatimonadetes bacterium]|nr:hypothetical protein [Gemmatimonadota bacterium]